MPSDTGLRPLQIGWYGLGAMGYFMAGNIAISRNPHSATSSRILVYNCTIFKAAKLVKETGVSTAKIASSPAHLATECGVIFTNLANDVAVQSVYDQFTKALSETPPTNAKIFVDTSTTYPALVGDIDRLLSSFPHCHFVACPVFGPTMAADAGKLVIEMNGDYRSRREVAYLMIPDVCRKVINLCGNIEKAPTLKLIGNGMIMGANELLAETLTLGEKSGIEAQTVYGLVKEIMPAPSLIAYGERMVNVRFDGSNDSAIDLGIKYSMHIRRMTAELNCPLPAKVAGTQKWDIIDWGAMIAGSRVAAGLDPFDSSKVRDPSHNWT
ncbi:NAD(P)-binding protein [Melanogaster broomeanus]|nr:NAD(P)-binding protein [Melanogaster broomeanus]